MTTAAQDEYNELFRDKSRRTQHPEDDDGNSIQSEEEEAQADHALLADLPDNLKTRDFVPRQKFYSNTGPKGVIADAQAFEAAKREQRNNPNYGTSPQRQEYLPQVGKLSLDRRSKKSSSNSGSDLESEDEFMASWRKQRLQQLSTTGHKSNTSISQPRTKKTYGGLVTVDGEGFLDAVDRSPSNTVVVVFIYDDSSEVSFEVEDCMRQLARRHNGTRFIKLHYLEAEIEVAGVPAVLAYRGGDKFAGLVPIVDEIPDDADLSVTSLEHLFQKHQIL